MSLVLVLALDDLLLVFDFRSSIGTKSDLRLSPDHAAILEGAEGALADEPGLHNCGIFLFPLLEEEIVLRLAAAFFLQGNGRGVFVTAKTVLSL